MSGIIDSKQRIIDFTLTRQAKEQLSRGELRIRFATFSDSQTFYEGTNGIADDASNRIMLESFQRIQDQIVPVAVQNGQILNYQVGDIRLVDNTILSGSTALTTPGDTYQSFLSGTFTNFQENYILSERDDFFNESQQFGIEDTQINFKVRDIPEAFLQQEFTAEDFRPLILDPRFSAISNFAYRPPVDLFPDSTDSEEVRSIREEYFADISGFGNRFRNIAEYQSAVNELRVSLEQVYSSRKLDITSVDNRPDIVVQFFMEEQEGEISKLVSIDMGMDNQGRHIYQVGKLLTDNQGVDRFVDSLMVVIS